MAKDRHQVAPFPLRMPDDIRQAAEKAKVDEDRSLTWVLNDRLRKGFELAPTSETKNPALS